MKSTYVIKESKIYNDDFSPIIVSSDGDYRALVTVKCKESNDYGPMDFSMDVEVADEFCKAILEQVNYIKGRKE